MALILALAAQNPTLERPNPNRRRANRAVHARAPRPPTSRSTKSPPRQPKSERPDAFNPTLWLIEGVGGFLDEIQHNDLGLPEDFWVHAYAARKEGLLAARALIDHAIQRSDDELAKAAKKEEKQARRGGVDIDFGS